MAYSCGASHQLSLTVPTAIVMDSRSVLGTEAYQYLLVIYHYSRYQKPVLRFYIKLFQQA